MNDLGPLSHVTLCEIFSTLDVIVKLAQRPVADQLCGLSNVLRQGIERFLWMHPATEAFRHLQFC